MVNLLATTPSNRSLGTGNFSDPLKRFLLEKISTFEIRDLADIEVEVDRQIAEAIATVEKRRPGSLALALVALVDEWTPRVYFIPTAVTGGRDLLRERLRDDKARYDDGQAAKAAWRAIRDQVLVEATLYFSRLAAGERFVPDRVNRSAQIARLTEKIWFAASVLRIIN